jgi:hypothetical protein
LAALRRKQIRTWLQEHREVAKEPPRTDKAILAAVTAVEGERMDLEQLREALPRLTPPLRDNMLTYVREAIVDDPRPIREMPGDNIDEALGWVKEHEPVGHLQRCRRQITYVLALLRHHQPGFDELTHEQKLAYIEQACVHINEFLKALRRLAAFLEFGDPNRELREETKQAERDVRAAVLKDVDGLTYMEIAKELGEPIPKQFKDSGDHVTVRHMVKRGRHILEKALGKEGWRAQAGVMRAEAARWRSLSEEERRVEHVAEIFFMTTEEARRFVNEEQRSATRQQATTGEPEEE